ncbi:MAG: hypothetical protein Q8L34_02345 [Candidatus Woesearchaeota archaeon]|nr:hypothetical protein [Candidatus Woesearchaeota archaeon]
MEFLARGKRGEVFLTQYKGKTVVVKQVRPTSQALSTLENEAGWLQRVNTEHIGPKFFKLEEGKLFMEYIQGVPIGEYVEKHPLSMVLAKEILDQCRVLDKLHVNKFEMHHPTKHILIKAGKPSRKTVVMIDFERCRWTEKPKNVTQFVQFLLQKKGYKGKQLENLLKQYKQTHTEESYKQLIQALFS